MLSVSVTFSPNAQYSARDSTPMSVPPDTRALCSMAKAADFSGGKRSPSSVSTTMLAHPGPQPDVVTVALSYPGAGYGVSG